MKKSVVKLEDGKWWNKDKVAIAHDVEREKHVSGSRKCGRREVEECDGARKGCMEQKVSTRRRNLPNKLQDFILQ